MAFTENFNEFFDTNDFAITVNFTTPALGTVKGIWDAETYEVPVGEATIHKPQPVFTCATGEISGVGEGSLLTKEGQNYKVIDRIDDGTGVSQLMLHQQA
jgi:hypothetical protein